jgi:TolA-binding protein
MTPGRSLADSARLAWTLCLLSLGLSLAIVSVTFWRDRKAAVEANALILAQQKTIIQLQGDINALNNTLGAMQEGIRTMQNEIAELRKPSRP